MSEPDRVPRYARGFVAVLLTAMLAAALFAWEPWPLTSFRLFSHQRSDEQSAWVARTVSPDGVERDYRLGSAPRGFRGFAFTMGEFGGASEARRDELCRLWVGASGGLTGTQATAVRIYRRTWLLSERDGDRALPGSEELVYTCDGQGLADA